MKYKQKSFTIPYLSDDYKNNWEDIFNTREVVKLIVGDLVAVKDGGWENSEPRWKEDTNPSYWFGVIDMIGSSDRLFRVKHFTIRGDQTISWCERKEIYFIKRCVQKLLSKKR
jgi:hypothetical protein